MSGPDDQFCKIVGAAASAWLPIRRSGVDPNTIDLWWLARRIEEQTATRLPTNVPPKDLGVTLIEECVEKGFISGLIRHLSRDELALRAWTLGECAKDHGLALTMPLLTVAALFHAWTGCIGMAKDLRRTTSTGEVYTDEVRRGSYRGLREMWEDEERRGNPWLRYGATLAREFERRRGNDVQDEWVPEDSPYWQ